MTTDVEFRSGAFAFPVPASRWQCNYAKNFKSLLSIDGVHRSAKLYVLPVGKYRRFATGDIVHGWCPQLSPESHVNFSLSLALAQVFAKGLPVWR